MKVLAHAKINLSLDVVGRREDGYHELNMMMLPLELHDEIEIQFAPQDVYTCDDPHLVMDEHNTVVRALQLMRSTYQLKETFAIHLIKHIPSEAGLAGGSADGAAVLRGIRTLCQLDISDGELAALGKQIGADVPFCVLEQSAIVKGIGERVTPIHFDWTPYVLLVKPNQGVSTKQAFSMLDFSLCDHPDMEEIKACLEHHTYMKLDQIIGNSLEYSAFQLVPEIAHVKQQLQSMGLSCTLMSGSGSTVFAMSEDKEKIEKAKAYFTNNSDHFVQVTSIYTKPKG